MNNTPIEETLAPGQSLDAIALLTAAFVRTYFICRTLSEITN